jgi:uncharacterized protein (TIGR02284 family)
LASWRGDRRRIEETAMDPSQTIEKLNDLIGLDYDAVGAYDAAIHRIDVESIRARLAEFREDHRRHIRDLSAQVRQLGGTPREHADAKGFILKGFTAVTSMMGNEAALRAMQGNEKLTNSSYGNALRENWPESVRHIIERNHHDEQRHLAYIEDALRNRIWETGGVHP